MKRLLAMLMAGCMLVQPLPGSAVVALGAETDGVIALADGGGAAADMYAEDEFAADTGSDVELGVVEEVAPDDVSGEAGDFSQIPSPDAGAATNDGDADIAFGDEIIDDVEIISPIGEDAFEDETEESAGNEEESEPESESEEELLEWELTETSTAVEAAEPAASEASGKSYLEVKVASGLPFYPAGGLKVTVGVYKTDNADPWMVKDITLSAPEGGEAAISESTVDFEVTPGDYKISVNAPKFARYVHNVTVGAYERAKICISTSRTVNELSKAATGWMRLGDVTNGYTIEQEDIDVILAAMRNEGTIYDANLNEGLEDPEKVDLADLQLAVQSLYSGEQQSTVERQQIPMKMEADKNTTVVGNLEDLFNGSGDGGEVKTVSLGPTNGGQISENNPVAVSFDLVPEGTSAAELPKVEGMTIKAPVTDDAGNTTTGISGGQVEVTVVENGVEKILLVPMREGTRMIAASMPIAAAAAVSEPEAVMTAAEAAPAEISAGEDIVEISGDAEVITVDNGINAAAISEETAVPNVETETPVQPQVIALPTETVTGSKATVSSDGSIVLDFGRQVAVKKVTIKITGTTKKESKLVDIAKVEFVNNMEDRIPEPELNIPEPTATPGNEEITVTWNAQTNVTGYEVRISGEVKKAGQQEQTVRVSGTTHTFVAINNNDLLNFKTYTIQVRSINGEWKSPWSAAVKATPKPESKPAVVDNVKVEGGYRSLSLSWKDMDDANGYMVYYQEKSAAGAFKPAVEGFVQKDPAGTDDKSREESGKGRITTNRYTITGLKDNTVYRVYVIGWNDLGWGSYDEKRIVEAKTSNMESPQLPKYHAINAPTDDTKIGVVTPHIKEAWGGWSGAAPKDSKMIESPLDAAEKEKNPNSHTGWGVVDNNYESYWKKYDWDDGYVYPPAANNDLSKGVTVQLDKAYKMSYLTYSALDIKTNPTRVRIYYWNTTDANNGTTRQEVPAKVIAKTDANNHTFFVIKFGKAITADKIQMCLGRVSGDFDIKIAEVRFHECDGLYEDIMGLFENEMHTSLKADVTADKIAALKTRLEEKDPASQEKHPLYDTLKLEIKLAEELLAESSANETIKVETGITAARDTHLGFGGLNPWQPLGRVAAAGQTLVVYVGHNLKDVGEESALDLVFTQYHAQSNELTGKSVRLKTGRNEVTVPQITSESRERGGQLYVAYTGNDALDQYSVRVLGGEKIPMLNIYNLTGADKAAERKAAIEAYVKELEAYVKTIKSTHDSLRPAKTSETEISETWKTNVDQEYDEKNCFLNATDLMMNHMMYSVPALQVWNSINRNGTPAENLENGLLAMEDTMTLFYQHKGLSNDSRASKRGNNALPAQHLNIRYMQMFAGAFMYASGNHIGVEYPETNVVGAANWDSFGWGIGHEIGHDINQSSYAIAEITNNYFAQLITKASNGTRFKYESGDASDDIYKKVTSGAYGRSSNGAVQLGLYWQLHLAFDDYTVDNAQTENPTLHKTGGKETYVDDRYIFSDYEEQFKNLFFARVDTYARNPGNAPLNSDKGKAVALQIGGGVDQTLMRLSCAAAQKNILSFFERWGMVPDDTTVKFAEQYPLETKALYYVNDDARDYRAAHKDEEEATKVTGKDVVTAAVSAQGNKASITITPNSAADKDVLLGYEIIRTMYSNGTPESQVVGFKLASGNSPVTYVDEISSVNNRVMYYSVKAVDKFLNYSNEAKAGNVKIETNGALDKEMWSAETTMTSTDDSVVMVNPDGKGTYQAGDDPDSGFNSSDPKAFEPKKIAGIDKAIDGTTGIVYSGTSAGSSEIVIDMHKFETISSVMYEGTDVGNIGVSISTDNTSWTSVADGTKVKTNGGVKTIWLDAAKEEAKDHWIGTYTARYVKLTFNHTGAVEIKEIDVCGPSGDNLEFKDALTQETGAGASKPVIGELAEDYVYSNKGDKIPAGSLIFTGTYKGNPAYNVVLLYDMEGNVVGSHEQEDGTVGVDAEQVIFANVPAEGKLGETADGTWVYYVTKDNWSKETLDKIRETGGVRGELFRVDVAQKLEGERIVSDTQLLEIPDELPTIKMTGGRIPGEN